MTPNDRTEIVHQMKHIDDKLDAFMAEMRRELGEIKIEVSETRDIVKAWEAVKTGGKFVKWLGAVVLAAAAIYVTLKDGFFILFKG